MDVSGDSSTLVKVAAPKAAGPEGAALALAGTLLTACGGGADAEPPAQMLALSTAEPMKRILATGGGEGSAAAAASAPTAPTATELFDWAERNYAVYFPGHKSDLAFAPYVYRYYPETQNYVGVANGRVYILGPVSGGVLGDVGAVTDFAQHVYATQWPYSDAAAARFLGQATLGYTDADIAAVRSLGFEAWLTQEIARPISQSNWDWLVSKGIDKDPNAQMVATGFDPQIWQRLLSASDGLRQRVTLALAEIFVVGFDGITGGYKQFKMAAYWDVLASNAFGNFRTLLEAVTLNPAMGSYLNTAGNQKENAATGRLPDENYAREVMQLFSIGLFSLNSDGTVKTDANGKAIESYTQDTVSQLARCFTGWNLNAPRGETGPEFVRRPMIPTEALHSTLAATFLGTTVPANTNATTSLRMALDALANHANVGPFIGSLLIQRLVTSNPSPAYVGRVAAKFSNNGQGVRGDLAAVVRAILLDEEARSLLNLTNPKWGKLREPMLRFIQWARSFKGSSSTGDWNVGNTSDPARSLGQSPQRSPSVFNYFRPGYVPAGTPIGSAGMVAPEFQLANESSVAGYLNFMQSAAGNGHRDIKANYATELALATDANALVDRVALLLTASQLTPATRTTIVNAVNSIASATDTNKANRVYTAVFLVMASLDYLVQK